MVLFESRRLTPTARAEGIDQISLVDHELAAFEDTTRPYQIVSWSFSS